jgi:hypothetical protein
LLVKTEGVVAETEHERFMREQREATERANAQAERIRAETAAANADRERIRENQTNDRDGGRGDRE